MLCSDLHVVGKHLLLTRVDNNFNIIHGLMLATASLVRLERFFGHLVGLDFTRQLDLL